MFRNFSWLIENELAGMARPSSFVKDFEFLKDEGLDAIVSFTEDSLQKSLLEEFGFEYLHVPIADFSIPSFEQINEFITFANNLIKSQKKLVVHCASGIGRTGTMLAIYLVNKGYTAEDAIDEVRKKRPGSIETTGQENMIFEYEKVISKK